MKKILLIRHGEKESGYFYNETVESQDPPLTHLGEKQAKKTGKRFRIGDLPEYCSIFEIRYYPEHNRFVLHLFNDFCPVFY